MPLARRSPRSAPPIFWRDPALPFVEARQSWDSLACYRPHTHPTVSVGIIDQGSTLLALPGRTQRMQAGDVVVIDAGVVHSCNPQKGRRWSYRMYYFDAGWLDRVLARAGIPAAARTFNGHLPQPAARRLFAAMTRGLQEPAGAAGRERGLARDLVALYRLIEPSASKPPPTPRPASLALEKICAYLADHCGESISVRALAAGMKVSPYRLIRAFKRKYGLTPHAYQLDQRIWRAREMMKAGRKAPEVAYELGFADQSHFQRAFKTRVAATPGEYHRKRSRLRAA